MARGVPKPTRERLREKLQRKRTGTKPDAPAVWVNPVARQLLRECLEDNPAARVLILTERRLCADLAAAWGAVDCRNIQGEAGGEAFARAPVSIWDETNAARIDWAGLAVELVIIDNDTAADVSAR